MPSLLPCSGLEQVAKADRHDSLPGEPGVTIALRTAIALSTVMARRDRKDALARRVQAAFGFDLPFSPRRVAMGAVSFVWAGPGHWLVVAEGVNGCELEARLRAELSGLALVSDQSDGRAVVRVSGARARSALAKGVPLDLHPLAFSPGDAAVTTVAHVGVHFWQVDEVPTYEFAVFRSFTPAFWQWLVDSSAEFGLAISGSK